MEKSGKDRTYRQNFTRSDNQSFPNFFFLFFLAIFLKNNLQKKTAKKGTVRGLAKTAPEVINFTTSSPGPFP